MDGGGALRWPGSGLEPLAGRRPVGFPRVSVEVHRCDRAGQAATARRSRLPRELPSARRGHGARPDPGHAVPRTLFDLAALLDLRRLERAINEAEVLRLWDELSLRDLLRRHPARPGARNVRAALRNRSAGGFTRSDLEAFFLSFADRFGFPQPATNVVIEGFEVDCVWRRQRVIIEVDGWATHRTRAAFERDRERSRVLQAAGWRCVAVTDRQLQLRPQEVARDLRGMLRAVPRAA